MGLDITRLKDMATTDFEKQLIEELDEQVQSQQFTELDADGTDATIGAGQIKIFGDYIEWRDSDGNIYKVQGTAV